MVRSSTLRSCHSDRRVWGIGLFSVPAYLGNRIVSVFNARRSVGDLIVDGVMPRYYLVRPKHNWSGGRSSRAGTSTYTLWNWIDNFQRCIGASPLIPTTQWIGAGIKHSLHIDHN